MQLLGFIDDYMALKKQRSLGLRGWVKIFLLVIICVYFILFARFILNIGTYINIPFTGIKIELGNWYYIIVALIVISTTNAVNLTDGLDGLAAGSSSIVLAVFCFIAFLEWTIGERAYAIDIAVIAGSTLAASTGFYGGIQHRQRYLWVIPVLSVWRSYSSNSYSFETGNFIDSDRRSFCSGSIICNNSGVLV